ncbi:class I SAM-dependent methyltransferase [Mycobacterium marseillense]|uniref:site-specific DNA-methyltransferase (adenine-specific) n=1 Tax=Mycobacterium marseillense TaxID=701042 RepID=A0AAD0E1I3_9MYCO|nr:class I SAM-dependent methyltransferase [Mycobacterium marseillense]ASW91805.1 SAM-dependent methyltransferase [Mycobacterium marseillense]
MNFAGKAAASADKVRGGYYTPAPVARFLAGWVREAGPKIVEPSCGDGAILRELAALSDRAHGVELSAREAAKARRFAPVDADSLFTWLAGAAQADLGGWDGVAGNPPYIRFGHWAAPQREPALELMRREGLRPTRLTNAWVPFVVASTVLVRDGGRVGLVLPAELLQVTYAAPLRDFLLSRFREITLLTFERLVFDGILQEVVLFCGVTGPGPARIRTVRLTDADALARAELDVEWAPALLHDNEKWTKYFLDPAAIRLLRSLKGSGALLPLGSLAEVDVGIVTGRNAFFTLTDTQAAELGLRPHCVPLVSRSAQLSGLVYDTDCRASDVAGGQRSWLLNAPREPDDPALIAHIRAGEAAGVHRGYKCSIRRPWWRTPSLWVPDLFLLRQIHRAPRLTVNGVGAVSTDTVHRVRLTGEDRVDPAALAAVFHNSVTFAFAEIMGRSYGGGVLELEPGEAEQLPIPAPAHVEPDLAGDVDLLLKANEIDKALDLVDRRVLIEGLGLAAETVADCRAAWASLADRRKRRAAR